jgi:hypothetical protein
MEDKEGIIMSFEEKRSLEIKALLTKIYDRAQDTSPVKIQIGYTNKTGHCYHNTITIIECAPAILKTVIDYLNEDQVDLFMDAGKGGVHIY